MAKNSFVAKVIFNFWLKRDLLHNSRAKKIMRSNSHKWFYTSKHICGYWKFPYWHHDCKIWHIWIFDCKK